MHFEMLKEKSSIIKVIGVGGGGGNAVNHMYKQGITGVDFIICNTDAQALELSPIPNKVQLGASLTEGMGAGSIPEVGKNSAIENIDDIKQMLALIPKCCSSQQVWVEVPEQVPALSLPKRPGKWTYLLLGL